MEMIDTGDEIESRVKLVNFEESWKRIKIMIRKRNEFGIELVGFVEFCELINFGSIKATFIVRNNKAK